MQPQTHYEQTGKKYNDHRGDLSDNQIAALLRGQVAYAVPYAAAGLASVLAFDVDSDHLPDPATPIYTLLAELERRDLWAFAQYDPDRRRGYVWAPFADLAHAGRLAVLGDQILATIQQPGWKIENRTSQANAHSDTRLPLCRHTWTGRRGLLILPDQQLDLDADSDSAIAILIASWQPNPLDLLPDPPAPAPDRPAQADQPSNTSNITIDRYNRDNDLIALLESYGATHGGRRVMHCCGHPDQRRASLVITIKGNRVLCQCMSAHHNCPLSGRRRDAFGVYCAMEGIDDKVALRRLNGKPDQPPRTFTPQTRSDRPAATRATTPDTLLPPTPDLLPAQLVTTPADGRRIADEHPKLPKSALRILAEIACHPTGYILGKNRLAETLDIDRSTVRRNLRALEKAGAIRTQRRGGGHTDVYYACPLTTRGGQMPPTCNHESDLIPTPDLAGRGGQSAGPIAPQAHEQADDLADAGGMESGLLACDDQAEAAKANLVPLADDQADSPPAISVTLADDQADSSLLRDELVCGAELSGPAGAFVVVGGAAYVPAGAEPWYAAICAAIAPLAPDQADDQVEAAQLVAPLDGGNLPERDAPAGQSDTGDLAESAAPASVPVPAVKSSRTASKPERELQAYQCKLDRMSGSELAGELKKWHNTKRKRGPARWISDRIRAVEREIERRDLFGCVPSSPSDQERDAGDLADDQADLPPVVPGQGPQPGTGMRSGAGLPPPPCSSGFGAGSSSRIESQRQVWRSPVVRCDWEPIPFEPKTAPRRAWEGATLGQDMAAMLAAHEAVEALRRQYEERERQELSQGRDVAVSHVDSVVAELAREVEPGAALVEASSEPAGEEPFGEGTAQSVDAFGFDAELPTGFADGVLEPAGQGRAVSPEPVAAGRDGGDRGVQFGAALIIQAGADDPLASTLGIGAPDADRHTRAIDVHVTQPGDLVVAQPAGVDQVEHLDQIAAAAALAQTGAQLGDLGLGVASACGGALQVVIEPVGDQFSRGERDPLALLKSLAQLAECGQGGLDMGIPGATGAQGADPALDQLRGEVFEPARALTAQGIEQGQTALAVGVEGGVAEDVLMVSALLLGLLSAGVFHKQAAQDFFNLVFQRWAAGHGVGSLVGWAIGGDQPVAREANQQDQDGQQWVGPRQRQLVAGDQDDADHADAQDESVAVGQAAHAQPP
jgi:hypothetical protein